MQDYSPLLARLRTPDKVDRLILPPSARPGAFDSHATDGAFLFRHAGRFYMTYLGWDSHGYQTGLAHSDDLLNWTREGIIVGRQPGSAIVGHNAAMTSILRDNDLFGGANLKRVDGRFWGTYHAYPEPGYEVGAAVIGLCSSDDLRNWRVHDPVLRAEEGAPWERGGLYKSWLMEFRGTYHLFYNAKNQTDWPWNEQIGVATSKDLIHWRRDARNPILTNGAAGMFDDVFASDPCVFSGGGAWIMFYFGLCSDRKARDSVAFSNDLRTWHKSNEILINTGPPGSIDCTYAHKPAMIASAGRLYHFYTAVSPNCGLLGQIEHNERRGIAVATGPMSEPCE